MPEPLAWIDGAYVPVSQARLHVFDSGIVHGDSVAEMIRTFGGKPFRLDEHLSRLQHSLDVALITGRPAESEWTDVVETLLEHNAKLLSPDDDLGMILSVTSGTNLTYVGQNSKQKAETTAFAHTFPLPFELWAESFNSGLHLAVPDQIALPPDALDPTAKVRSRIAWRIADRQVRRKNPGSVALLTDGNGHLRETSSGNVFVLTGDRLRTPPAGTVLPGVSRSVVIELARKIGLAVSECEISVEEAQSADEMWISSTPYCLLPVTHFGEHKVGSATPGGAYRTILAAWSELVGLDIAGQMQNRASE